jgi:hypothetical protein
MDELHRRGQGPDEHGFMIALNLANTAHEVDYPGDCRWYGRAAENLASYLDADLGVGDLPGSSFLGLSFEVAQEWRDSITWTCDGQLLTLQVERGYDGLGAPTAHTALEEVLEAFRRLRLDPINDGVSVWVNSSGDSAYYEPGEALLTSTLTGLRTQEHLREAPWPAYNVFEFTTESPVTRNGPQPAQW